MMDTNYISVTGTIRRISHNKNDCCNQLLSLITENGEVQLNLSPSTYIVNQNRLRIGMTITGYYSADAPVPLIYPPVYDAVVITRVYSNEFTTLDLFDSSLTNQRGTLTLNPSKATEIVTANGQVYSCPLGDHLLLVFYSRTTRSIPAKTVPHKIIVMC